MARCVLSSRPLSIMLVRLVVGTNARRPLSEMQLRSLWQKLALTLLGHMFMMAMSDFPHVVPRSRAHFPLFYPAV